MHVFTASPALSEAVIKEMDDDFGLILPKSLEIRIPTMHTKHIAPGTPYRVTAVRDDDDEFSADGMSLEVRTLADKYLFSVDADQILDKLACDPLAASQRALDPYKRWVVFAAYFRHLDTLVDPNAPEDEFDEEFDEFDEDSEIEEHK
jgi:hypothetical protein